MDAKLSVELYQKGNTYNLYTVKIISADKKPLCDKRKAAKNLTEAFTQAACGFWNTKKNNN